jgi:thiol:disulfide interchange protein DsbD
MTLARVLMLLALLTGALRLLPAAQAADAFLDPEQAFRVSARLVDARTVELQYNVAPGYYLYRDRFAFEAQGATLGAPQLPAGQVKYDENFQKNVETLRGELRVTLPLVAAAVGPFTLQAALQGCADAGLCYPPQTTALRLDPAALGVSVTAGGPAAAGGRSPPSGSFWASLGDGEWLERTLGAGQIWPALGAFLLVGLLLSLTPCVLPMLPILSSLIVGTGERPTRARGLALAGSYSLGMALVYTALGVAAGLAGEGFAAALQTPWAIAGFSALLLLFSLAMFDVYELRLPARFTSHVSAQCDRLPAGRLAGVFAMGGLSALIVSPCVTAPLAAALLFIGQSRDVVLGGGALFAMAMGMSAPLLLLGVSSGRWMPRSGPWMVTVKRFFGVLMLGLAIWLAQPILPASLLLGLWGLLLLLAGLLLRPLRPGHGHRHALRSLARRVLGAAALLLGTLQLLGAATGGHDPLLPLAHLGQRDGGAVAPLVFERVRSVQELDAVLAATSGPVVLDFYADWCVSCKEMERFTFGQAHIAGRLAKARLLKADVTANTAADRALLRRFRLFGPPGTLFFDAQGREIAEARVIGFQGPGRFARTLERAGL